jgi:hypothetical protein
MAMAAPKKRLVMLMHATVRFLKRYMGMMGSFANFHSTIIKMPRKQMPRIKQTRTVAELHAYCTPPKFRATKIKVANAKMLKVPRCDKRSTPTKQSAANRNKIYYQDNPLASTRLEPVHLFSFLS